MGNYVKYQDQLVDQQLKDYKVLLMSERLGSHALALGLELEEAIPVETPGFPNDVINRASELKVLAGPSKDGSVFVPFTVMVETSSWGTPSSDRFRKFCKAFHTGDERLEENDPRKRLMISHGTIFSLQGRCGDPLTLAQRARAEIE